MTRETDSLGSGYGGQTGKYVTITAMPAYRQKSVEELRYEDYKQGVKGNAGASPLSMSSARVAQHPRHTRVAGTLRGSRIKTPPQTEHDLKGKVRHRTLLRFCSHTIKRGSP